MQHAYAAGMEAGKMQAQQQAQSQVPQVKFLGHVRNPAVLWTDGLTLAKALVDAEYLEQNTPRTITIYRNGQPMPIDPQTLLAGQDYPLFPGDTIVIQN
jgi:fumarate reductase subunit C